MSPYGNRKVTKTIPKALLSMPSKQKSEKLLETRGNGHSGTHNNDLNMEKETLPLKRMKRMGNTQKATPRRPARQREPVTALQ